MAYYVCSEPGCGHKSSTEKAAIAHYHTHFTGNSIVRVQDRKVEPVRYKSKIANAIERGGAKVRSGLRTYGEIGDAINSNFDFGAAIDNFSGDYDFGAGLTGGLMGQRAPRRPRQKRSKR